MAEAAPEARQWVRLTRVCNQRCLFCHDRPAQDGSMRPLPEILRELRSGRRRGLRRVVLSGGEPTLHPEFLGIVSRARGMGYAHIQVVTNGRRLCYPGFLEAAVAAGLGEVTFSLHGHTAALHDALTRTPGSYLQAVSGLKNALARAGLIVSVDVVINRMNLPHLREILEHFMALGVWEFDLLWLIPFGDAWDHRGALYCDLEDPEQRAQLSRALELARDPRLHLWTNRLPARHLEGFAGLIQPPEKLKDEVRGRAAELIASFEAGRPLECRGERCRRCFLEDFCRDLDELRSAGVLRAKVPGRCSRASRRPGRPPVFRLGRGVDLDALTRFYISHRYFLRSRACGACALGAGCDGLPIAEVRRDGFPSGLRHG